jgi:hypothetical protein
VQAIDRGQFLRLGAIGAGAVLGGGALASTAAAALPTATPVADDVAFVQLGAVGERVTLELYRAARHAAALPAPERRRAGLARAVKARQLALLDDALGEDAIRADDFEIALPEDALATRKGIAVLGRELEGLLVGLYLNGVQNAEDRSTRLLLGRLLAYDVQQLAWWRTLRGGADQTEVPAPQGVEQVGARLDRYLRTPGVAPS